MKVFNTILTALLCITPLIGANAAVSKCSKTNITRCLDSACAINVGMNPSARCQYCGTSNAGEPPTQKGLSNITAGQSTKYSISAKDLSNAPSNPSSRYSWAVTECLKKVSNCTADEAYDTYDKLIEQSCKAAGVTAQITRAVSNATTKPSKSKCNTTFTTCINKKCGTRFETCASNPDFDRAVAECAAEASGCDEYIAEFRKTMSTERTNTTEKREQVVLAIVEKYKNDRENKLANAKSSCSKGNASESCINTVCANNMRGKCDGADATSEKAMAKQLCKFYETACTVLK